VLLQGPTIANVTGRAVRASGVTSRGDFGLASSLSPIDVHGLERTRLVVGRQAVEPSASGIGTKVFALTAADQTDRREADHHH
jgi:hypothetical protein